MIFVGIDVASTKHDIAIVSSQGEVLTEAFTIQNSLEGFKKLRKEIISHTESLIEVHIGIEETGIYSKNIAEFLALCGFIVHMINPVLTSNSRKSQSVRLTKTDKIDCLTICRYLAFNFKRLNSYTPTLYIFEELKSLSRARIDIQKKIVKAKTEWARLLDLTFPEFKKNFNHQSKWVYALFNKYPSADKIARAHFSTLVDIIATKGERHSVALLLKDLATNTIGQKHSINDILITNVLSDISHYYKQMTVLEETIETLVSDHFTNILTIPGIGPITAGLIIGEIGDINRFHSSAALLAYAGLDPTIYESGNFKAKNARISKRGSSYLRTALFTSTKVACINPNIRDNNFKHKYQRKIAQGKHHYSAICHVTKNMTNVIFKLLQSGDDYIFI